MEAVWFEVAIVVVTMLCSDLNPAALLPQPEPQPTSDEHGNDHSSDCTAVLLSWEAGIEEKLSTKHSSSSSCLAGYVEKPQTCIPDFADNTQCDGEHLWAVRLVWVAVCDEAGMFCTSPSPCKKQYSSTD